MKLAILQSHLVTASVSLETAKARPNYVQSVQIRADPHTPPDSNSHLSAITIIFILTSLMARALSIYDASTYHSTHAKMWGWLSPREVSSLWAVSSWHCQPQSKVSLKAPTKCSLTKIILPYKVSKLTQNASVLGNLTNPTTNPCDPTFNPFKSIYMSRKGIK